MAPTDISVLRRFLQLEYLLDKAYADIKQRGMIDSKGDPRRMLDDFRKMAATSLNYAMQLGLSPKSRMDVSLTTAKPFIDMDALRAELDAVSSVDATNPALDAETASVGVSVAASGNSDGAANGK